MLLLRPIIRILSLANEEILQVVRQPFLLLALVLGPFLILFIFGIGHRAQQPPLTTILVIPPSVEMPRDTSYWKDRFGGSVNVVAVTPDQARAESALKSGQVDLAVVIPSDAATAFAHGKSSPIQVLTNNFDPVQQSYIDFVGYVLSSELNKQVIAEAVARAQQDLKSTAGTNNALTANVTAAQNDLKAGNVPKARQDIASARSSVDGTRAALHLTEQLIAGMAGSQEGGAQAAEELRGVQQVESRLDAVSTDLDRADSDLTTNPAQASADLARAAADLGGYSAIAAQVEAIPPGVAAAPFVTQVRNLAPIQPGFVQFFSPGVIALLLQHLAITIAALSIVRERLLGTIELYEVSPMSTAGLLIGKYVSYMVQSMIVGVALTVLVVETLQVPLRGDPFVFLEVLGLLVFASVGIGLTLSLLSTSQENAVQYAMLVLLASVFFSGFFLPLNTLQAPATYIANALPVTYGILSLQDIMLLGIVQHPEYLASLAIIGGIFFVISAVLLHFQVRRT